MSFNRYDVHWVDLDPIRGSEMSKRRPAVIVSIDSMNRALKTVVICPLTTQLHPNWRSRLQIEVKGKACEIACDQIRGVTKERLGKKLHSLSPEEAAALRGLLSEMYGEA
jgi:mRNA interferase MazF